ncbi:MAG: hypothetical protein K2G88_02935 [Oscillospiraceae bacterium]|nr:hypothetical protein [Oscillospiraceae bacterium]
MIHRKTIIPVCTSGGNSIKNSINTIKKYDWKNLNIKIFISTKTELFETAPSFFNYC